MNYLANTNLKIEVYDLNGKLCLNKTITANKINIGNLVFGNYTYILKNENQFLQSGKFVKN